MLKRLILLLSLITFTSACNLLAEDAATLTPTPTETTAPTFTPAPTQTPQPTATITVSPTPTETPLPSATFTPAPTATATAPPTNTLIPMNTPLPVPGRAADNLELVDIPGTLLNGRPLVVFVNQNDSLTIRNLSTAEPENQEEILYIADPRNPGLRAEIARFNAQGNTPIYLAGNSANLAYFVDGDGLYVLDANNGISLRIVQLASLVQRGIVTRPAWSNDGRLLAVTLETGYSLDIIGYDLDAGTWAPLIQSGAYNFWPSFSPDGRYLAFVSDRATCPTWNPNEASACSDGIDAIPIGGQVYVLEIETGQITQISDQPTFEPPYWLNNRNLFFTTGDPVELLQPERRFFVANITDAVSREIRLNGTGETPNYLTESWSADGQRVIFQRATSDNTEIIAMSATGDLLNRFDDLSFARFTMSATWAPNGERLAVGGSSGQCPYGVRVFDRDFNSVGRGTAPPSMCNPQFSPDSSLIAYTGIDTARGDGRVDVYTTTANGFDRVGLTFDLRGSMRLIGWIDPS